MWLCKQELSNQCTPVRRGRSSSFTVVLMSFGYLPLLVLQAECVQIWLMTSVFADWDWVQDAMNCLTLLPCFTLAATAPCQETYCSLSIPVLCPFSFLFSSFSQCVTFVYRFYLSAMLLKHFQLAECIW